MATHRVGPADAREGSDVKMKESAAEALYGLPLARSIQLSDEVPRPDEPGPLAEVEGVLAEARKACGASDSDALVESAHFEWAVRGSAPRALGLLEEAENRLRTLIKDVLATKIRVLLELGEVVRAGEVATEVLRWFPTSFEVQEAHAEAHRE